MRGALAGQQFIPLFKMHFQSCLICVWLTNTCFGFRIKFTMDDRSPFCDCNVWLMA